MVGSSTHFLKDLAIFEADLYRFWGLVLVALAMVVLIFRGIFRILFRSLENGFTVNWIAALTGDGSVCGGLPANIW